MQEFEQLLSAVAEQLRKELSSIRTGRATPALLEDLEIDYYGAKTPLKAIASISVIEPRQLLIQPWDKTALPVIEKAIQHSSLGFAPIADRDTIRITIPPMTEERRKELVKVLGRHLEDARIKVRQGREDMLRKIDQREKSGEMSEDEKFRERRALQKDVDDANKLLENMGDTKEKEISTV